MIQDSGLGGPSITFSISYSPARPFIVSHRSSSSTQCRRGALEAALRLLREADPVPGHPLPYGDGGVPRPVGVQPAPPGAAVGRAETRLGEGEAAG